MLEFLSSVDLNVLKVVGMIVSGLTGMVMSWLSKRSVNYRKIDKNVVLMVVLYFVYLNVFSAMVTFASTIVKHVFFEEAFALQMLISLGAAIFNIAVFWGLIIKTKRMKQMMTKAKEVSRRVFLLINGLSIISLVIGYVYLPFILHGIQNTFTHILVLLSWFLSIWWFVVIITFIWRTANYVFSNMKITLVDGEIVYHNCSPQMCRVHKHYLRLIERGEDGSILSERHINETSIKEIEYR